MASSIASQLQAIKSFVQADSEPLKRPFTRPSILFDPKVAADIDVDTIFGHALEGQSGTGFQDKRLRFYYQMIVNLFSRISFSSSDCFELRCELRHAIVTTISWTSFKELSFSSDLFA